MEKQALTAPIQQKKKESFFNFHHHSLIPFDLKKKNSESVGIETSRNYFHTKMKKKNDCCQGSESKGQGHNKVMLDVT